MARLLLIDDLPATLHRLSRWHAERILAESAELEAGAPAEPDDDELAFLLNTLDAPDPAASDERREDSRRCAQWVIA